jgi:hypothetical protein
MFWFFLVFTVYYADEMNIKHNVKLKNKSCSADKSHEICT